MACEAQRWLTPDDWEVVRFYQLVRDQVNNLTPMGLEGGGCWLAPRVEVWLSVASAHGVGLEVVEDARYLHECCERRAKSPGVHRMNPLSLMPEPF